MCAGSPGRKAILPPGLIDNNKKPMKLIFTTLLFVSVAFAADAAVFSTNNPDKDAFVRAAAPTYNYGGGGALSVSGANATTSNPTNGAFDSFISFNTSSMVTAFNSAFGANNWVITSATLNLTINQLPGNPVFNLGSGMFAIRWIANDTWTEGTGNPNAPTMNGITYNQEPIYLNPNTDVNLGAFSFNINATDLSCPLTLPTAFVTNMQAGGEVGLFMTAIDPSVGFVFYSRQYMGLASTHPALVVSAATLPGITNVSLSGANLVLAATNGIAGWTYYVLTSTNLSTLPNQWTPIMTNVLGATGNFTITVPNAVNFNAAAPQFFMLQTQ
jgi:hypothetical protein